MDREFDMLGPDYKEVLEETFDRCLRDVFSCMMGCRVKEGFDSVQAPED